MKSLFKIAKDSGCCRIEVTRPDQLTYSVATEHKNSNAKYAVFIIGSKLKDEMRWMLGDRIDVLFDPEMAEGQLVRCKEGGWALTGRDGSKTSRVRLSIRKEFDLPDERGRVDLAVQTTESTIFFAFPIKYRKQKNVVTTNGVDRGGKA